MIDAGATDRLIEILDCQFLERSCVNTLREGMSQYLYGRVPEICALHAGLECAVLGRVA